MKTIEGGWWLKLKKASIVKFSLPFLCKPTRNVDVSEKHVRHFKDTEAESYR
jgi:hypothetical protein